MHGAISHALILLAGFGLGVLFYGGLWLTVRALPGTRHPTSLALASFWSRAGIVVAAFVLLPSGSWSNALICLLGFVVARIVLVRWIPHSATKKGLV